MWLALLLREFARRPTIDRPERIDPGLDLVGLREGRPRPEPQPWTSSMDYAADARWTSLLDH